MPKTPDAPIDLKEACVRAAHEFIAEQGVEQLSLRDVARRLGVSHQAPYKHYPSRDHLLAEVIRRCYRDFAIYLDARGEHGDPWDDLGALGRRYQAFAASHPVEYRLMFGTPWPLNAEESGLAAEATHAFDVLRTVLRRIHGADKSQRAQVDLDALFIWSNMHGMASIAQSSVMPHLGLAPGVSRRAQDHLRDMIGHAMTHARQERR
ncbi:MAG: TetR/AcrR family transcriptional regulator [Burkholderiaceae bacterium]|jgi:AcrR family transcriptional regulator|nr:TetR/AcrR family transcriptional regulator [Burkholderiaceae bacterium]